MRKQTKKPQEKKAWAVVKVKRPRISVLEIYDHTDIKISKDEKIIRVIIKQA